MRRTLLFFVIPCTAICVAFFGASDHRGTETHTVVRADSADSWGWD
jgi:hypothetical protein